ncbi:hypothetical protein KY342_04985 [Candidatus Woesearchaeota archaeon]|nr:hypothetical protein [Candidatus Woesearchaeota archaeon]
MTDLKKLKKGNYIIYEGEPCVIKDLKFVVYGTHSHTKAKIELEGLFSGKKIQTSLPLHEQLQETDIIRKCATVISKQKDKIQIMDTVNFETLDANIDSNLSEQAIEGDNVTYIQHGNSIKVIEIRKGN